MQDSRDLSASTSDVNAMSKDVISEMSVGRHGPQCISDEKGDTFFLT